MQAIQCLDGRRERSDGEMCCVLTEQHGTWIPAKEDRLTEDHHLELTQFKRDLLICVRAFGGGGSD